ncbi:MBL fold metallo-hydrolase [Commensalibacter nepenthis]|uniref:MBL fold metallo-hydrolase n=1 Tax=Commensalibacter nepenthis TaxID=3043872 RepID=A0ABT6Q6M0_9PROT|nr:MBL fold metallo-hydrolase [Commensalibacter sp. TBRC 10068]MDI2112541.1 MBL fold metallo-hydrolase [Commensalibacter sp. TBRC 10068]
MFLSIASLRIEIMPVTMLRQNCMMVWDQSIRKGIVTDPGGDLSFIIQMIEVNDVEIQAILLTHGHFDHVGVTTALQQYLQEKYQTEIPILGPSIEDQFLLEKVAKDAASFGVNAEHVQNVSPTRFLQDQEVLSFENMQFEVLHVPGHTPGHVVFYEAKARFMITGDVLFKGTIGRADFPYGNGNLLIQTIKDKLLPLGDDVYVLPGHGIGSTIGYEKLNNPFLI